MIYPCPIDFAAAWHDCTAQSPSHRGAAGDDLAYWEAHARGYDDSARAAGAFEGTLAALRALVRPTDTLLDVGAGTGRFAVPLAAHVQTVTALDHSGAMLDVLRERLVAGQIGNVSVVQAAWEEADTTSGFAPHDVVLAAWSLYRMPDILAAMHKLVAATRRTLVIVCSAGNSVRHDPLQRDICGRLDQNNTPLHLYFLGVLWQAGYQAELRLVTERRQMCGASLFEIARRLAPEGASPEEIARLAERLAPRASAGAEGYLYEHPEPVAMLVWQRPGSVTDQNH